MVIDGIFKDTIDSKDFEAANVPGTVVNGIFKLSPSGMVLDGITADTIDFQDCEAAIVPSGCSSSMASNASWGEAKETKGVQFFVNCGNSLSTVVRSSSHAVVSDVLRMLCALRGW